MHPPQTTVCHLVSTAPVFSFHLVPFIVCVLSELRAGTWQNHPRPFEPDRRQGPMSRADRATRNGHLKSFVAPCRKDTKSKCDIQNNANRLSSGPEQHATHRPTHCRTSGQRFLLPCRNSAGTPAALPPPSAMTSAKRNAEVQRRSPAWQGLGPRPGSPKVAQNG